MVNTFSVREILVYVLMCMYHIICRFVQFGHSLKPGQLRHQLHTPPLILDNPESFVTSSTSKLSTKQCEPSWRKRRTASWLSRMDHAGSSKIMVCRLLASLLFSNDKGRRLILSTTSIEGHIAVTALQHQSESLHRLPQSFFSEVKILCSALFCCLLFHLKFQESTAASRVLQICHHICHHTTRVHHSSLQHLSTSSKCHNYTGYT